MPQDFALYPVFVLMAQEFVIIRDIGNLGIAFHVLFPGRWESTIVRRTGPVDFFIFFS